MSEEITLAGGGSGQLPVMLWRGCDRRVQSDPMLRQNNLEVA
jgi:hypothetical protein